MKEVKLEYRFLRWFKKTKTLSIPSGWNELNANQYAACCDIYIKQLSDREFIRRFFGISGHIVKRFTKFHIYKLTELCTFAADPDAAVDYFYIDKIPGTKLFAPQRRLSNVTFEHFAIFDTFFFKYSRDENKEDLYNFIASLYLKKEEQISDFHFKKRVEKIKKNVPEEIINAIFLNYIFLHKYLEKPFPYLFESKEETDTEAEKKKQKETLKLPDWVAILDAFVGDDILNYDKYKNTNCMLMFKRINERLKNHKYSAA